MRGYISGIVGELGYSSAELVRLVTTNGVYLHLVSGSTSVV
jgi:hypothetical protein